MNNALISFEDKDAEAWISHATGKMSKHPKLSVESISLSTIEKLCSQEMPISQLYQSLQQRNINLGPSFRWLKSIYLGNREALGYLQLPATILNTAGYQLHPTLIDSCFQIFFAIAPIDGENTFIPLKLDNFKFFQLPETDLLWCHVSLRSSNTISPDQIIGDLQLCDHNGNLVMQVTGFEGRKANRQTLLRSLSSPPQKWLYQMQWQPQQQQNPLNLSSNSEPGSWLILSNGSELGLGLVDELRCRGQHCLIVGIGSTYEQVDHVTYQINPTHCEDFQKLLEQNLKQQPPLRGVIHLWSLEEISTMPEADDVLQQAQAISYASTLHLLQAIVQQISDLNYPHLYLLTRGSQKVTKELSQGQPLQSALWALGRIVRLEHPELRCICLDLPPITHLEQDIKTLLTELFFPSPENQLCYREGVRYVARLKRYIPTEQTTFTVQNNSTYLITGGLGALGLQSARWLVEKGATYLVLLGRSQPSAAAQEVITQLENEGIHIEIAATDISDIVSVTNLFEFLHKSLPPLRGVIHAAGVIDDGVISQQSWERFTSVLNPKIAGTWNLHCLTKNLPLDFFVCFSSMTSLIGNPGQASYAVANAFMDALANYRQADNLPGLSINWGPWEEIGMATHLKNASQRRMLAHGVSSISLDTGLKLLEELLKQDVYQIGVLPINWSQFFEQSLHHQDQLFLEAFVPTLEPENVETFDFFQQLKTAPIHEKRALLTEHIRNQVGKIIALEPSEIHPQQGFFELGMDSLTSMELKKSLEKSLGYDVPDTFIFNYPTIEAVVDYIAQQSIETETSAVAPKSTVIDDNMPLEGLEDLESLSEAEISELLTQKLDALD